MGGGGGGLVPAFCIGVIKNGVHGGALRLVVVGWVKLARVGLRIDRFPVSHI